MMGENWVHDGSVEKKIVAMGSINGAPVNVKEVTLEGICFCSKKKFTSGEKLIVSFPILDKKRGEKIIMFQAIEISSIKKMCYGASFTNLEEGSITKQILQRCLAA
ncbi:MAG: hypothetical protein WAV16_04605 [Candidatus Moraniibacteriota bacterium]